MTEGLSQMTVFFAFALALSLMIERLTEVLKCAYDLVDSRLDLYHFWTGRAERFRDRLQRKLRTLRFVKPEHVSALLARFDDRFAEGAVVPGRVPVISGNLVRGVAIKVGAKVLGVAVGIALALCYDMNLATFFRAPSSTAATTAVATSGGLIILQQVLTGVAMGLGSGPVHKVITTLEARQRKKREQREVQVG